MISNEISHGVKRRGDSDSKKKLKEKKILCRANGLHWLLTDNKEGQYRFTVLDIDSSREILSGGF
jgi:hypothetical protein